MSQRQARRYGLRHDDRRSGQCGEGCTRGLWEDTHREALAQRDQHHGHRSCRRGCRSRCGEPHQHFDGNLFSSLSGDTFCDIYNVATNTTKSIKLRDDGTLTNGANLKLFGEFDTDKTFGVNYSYKMPRLVISQGNIFVSAGDKIRIRGVYVDTAKAYENSGYKTEKYKGLDLNDLSRINDRQYTDQEVRRIYTVKFANLYRVGWKE